MADRITFPTGFVWGAATSSYQIEGGWNEDGKGLSIWDSFTRQPGAIVQGHTGDIAADHYHRMPADVEMMAGMGLKAYRFSFSWPRILPDGTGRVNQPGLDFYDRLIDNLLDKRIDPYGTMYHWDLPQVLQDKGGWAIRESADWFVEYADILLRKFGDRVTHWTTFNEPWVSAYVGYYTGKHAPGIMDLKTALAANHNLLLSHGKTVSHILSFAKQPAELGIVLNLSPVVPLSSDPMDVEAARVYDGYLNRMFLDPLLKGNYPVDMLDIYDGLMPEILPGDMETISQPLDYLGINFYMRNFIRHDPTNDCLNFELVWPAGNPYSELWEMNAPSLFDLIMRVSNDYGPKKILITENGTAVTDGLDADGRVRDPRRIQYLQDHLFEVHRAIQSGAKVEGYFAWSLMDNFEWSEGYTRRFGIVFIDYATQERIIKDSGKWYSRVIAENGFKQDIWYKDFA